MDEQELHAMLDEAARVGRREGYAKGQRSVLKSLKLTGMVRKAFDPAEPRAADGKWGSGGGKSGGNYSEKDSATHPDARSHAAHAAGGLPEKLPAGVWAAVGDRVLSAAAKAYGTMLRATPAALRAMSVLEQVIDTPTDLNKLGYNPSTGYGPDRHADPLKGATGLSTHVAATIASHVLGRAWLYAKSKLSREERKALGWTTRSGGAVWKGFDESEARDEGGKWTAGGGVLSAKAHGEDWAAMLDEDEADAVRGYTLESERINSALRNGFGGEDEYLDAALDKAATPADAVVYRGVQRDRGWDVGDEINDRAYFSSAKGRHTAADFADDFGNSDEPGPIFEIRLPAGSPASSLTPELSPSYGSEGEVLGARGSKLTITGVDTDDDGRTIYRAEVTWPDKS